ncbi:MAG: cyclodeaminase/cyclohydrolase family protein [Desulfosoma sp.]
MHELTQLTLDAFLDELASENPVPGGGSVAALAGALAAALTTMVARLTVGKEKFKDRWAALEPAEKDAALLMEKFQTLVQRDTDAYRAVVESLRLPKDTAEQKAARIEAMQKAFKEAARVPLETLLNLERLMDHAAQALRSGNPNAASDAGAAVQMIRAGAAIAAYNVWINLPSIQDPAFVGEARATAAAALQKIEDVASQCHEKLVKELTA